MGNYDWSDDQITNELFPLTKHATVTRVVKLIGFEHGPSTEEVLVGFESCGVERPTYEDALYFGIEYMDVGKHPIAFLHEPNLGASSSLGDVGAFVNLRPSDHRPRTTGLLTTDYGPRNYGETAHRRNGADGMRREEQGYM